MIVKVDRLPVIEFGRAVPRPDEVRFYYQVTGYDCLIIRCDFRPFVELIGEMRIALFEFDTIDGREVCRAFPKAPARWKEDSDLVQCSLRPFDVIGRPGKKMLLSSAIRKHLGDGC